MPPTISFQGHEVLELTNGAGRALFAPQAGGKLLTWQVGGATVIPWPDDADWEKVASVRGGNPLLFPFIARHYVNGQLGYWKNATGQVFQLPMHGFARNSEFKVVECGEAVIRMRLAGNAKTHPGYPFAYQFDAVYELIDNRLRATLEITNPGDDPMPYYAGHHFYFHVPHGDRGQWEVVCPCKEWGTQDERGEIHTRPAEGEVLSLADGGIVDRFQIQPTADEITLRNASTGAAAVIRLDAGGEVPWYAVTTWTQREDSDFFCVEPWLGLPNAIHHGMGLRYLSPGQTETAICELEATGW
ncbi:MAG: aldose epimerase [Verrucomicrobiota bacterium]